jgi:positive regulator of sigma E activity
MVKYYKFFEIAYLVIAVYFFVETYMKWNINRQQAYFYFAFAIVAVFMYFFRKRHRKNYEDQHNEE